MKQNLIVTMDDFKELYEKYGPVVLRRCRYILKNEAEALDAMQDVFVRIIEHRTTLKNITCSLFYTTATRVCLNKIRYSSYRNSYDIDDLENEITSNCENLNIEKIDAKLLLDNIFSDLKEKSREMAILHYIDGFTLEETAEMLSMSISGVRKRLQKIKEKAENCTKNGAIHED